MGTELLHRYLYRKLTSICDYANDVCSLFSYLCFVCMFLVVMEEITPGFKRLKQEANKSEQDQRISDNKTSMFRILHHSLASVLQSSIIQSNVWLAVGTVFNIFNNFTPIVCKLHQKILILYVLK
jgi:hypothetical protein